MQIRALLLFLAALFASTSVVQAQGAYAGDRSPVNYEFVVGMNQRIALPDYGGPRSMLTVQSVNDIEIVVRKSGSANERIEKKSGLGEARTLLLDDGEGCKVFFVERTQRAANEVILRIEHAAGSRSKPPEKPAAVKIVP